MKRIKIKYLSVKNKKRKKARQIITKNERLNSKHKATLNKTKKKYKNGRKC